VTLCFVIVRLDQDLPGLKALHEDPRRWLEFAGEEADPYQLQLQWHGRNGRWPVRQDRLEGFKGTGI
jgi:hypothetical protein